MWLSCTMLQPSNLQGNGTGTGDGGGGLIGKCVRWYGNNVIMLIWLCLSIDSLLWGGRGWGKNTASNYLTC